MELENNITYEQFKKTAEAVLSGSAYINSLSLEEEQGRRKGGRRNVEASLLTGGSKGTNSEEIRHEREKQERLLKWFA
jgi:hypothetical protein